MQSYFKSMATDDVTHLDTIQFSCLLHKQQQPSNGRKETHK